MVYRPPAFLTSIQTGFLFPLSGHHTKGQLRVSDWAHVPVLSGVNGLSLACLMWSLVLCDQVLSELRRVHFTGSQGTRSNPNAVVPPVCNNNTTTFHHCCAFIHFCKRAGTQEQTGKRTLNQRGITEPEADPCLPFLSHYLCQLHWNLMQFCDVAIQEIQCLSLLFCYSSPYFCLCSKQHFTQANEIRAVWLKKKSFPGYWKLSVTWDKYIILMMIILFLFRLTTHIDIYYLGHIFIHMRNRRSGLWWFFLVIIFISSQEKF